MANIYLHEVLDLWFERDVRPRMRGRCDIIRFADDAVLAFASESDARRVLKVLPKRFAKYGLRLHPEKTRLVRFNRPPRGLQDPTERPETFDFLGFTHYWAQSRKGYWVILRRTASSRLRRALQGLSGWLRSHYHCPLEKQRQMLSWMLRGHYAYFGIAGNGNQVWALRFRAVGIWRKWLSRRSQTGHVSWTKMKRIQEKHPLPIPGKLVLA